MGKRRILIVSPYFYPEGGGLERYAFNMARELSGENIIRVLCMTRGKGGAEDVGGIKVHRIRPALILSNTPLSLKFILKAVQMIKDSELVIAHTPVPFAADVASFIAKLRETPVKIVYHTVGLKKGARLLDPIAAIYSATLERLTLRGAMLTAVSHTVWKYLKKRGYNPRISLPPLDLNGFVLSGSSHPSRERIVLFVGQLGKYHRFKNLNLLIKAFAEISTKFPEWRLWVVGQGDFIEEYKKLASELGIAEKVRFLGRVDDPKELGRIYLTARILVLPSSFESFGMVIPEALSFGVPVVVAPDIGARIMVLQDKNGIVLDSLTVGSLATALRTLLDNPKQVKKFSHIAVKAIEKMKKLKTSTTVKFFKL